MEREGDRVMARWMERRAKESEEMIEKVREEEGMYRWREKSFTDTF